MESFLYVWSLCGYILKPMIQSIQTNDPKHPNQCTEANASPQIWRGNGDQWSEKLNFSRRAARFFSVARFWDFFLWRFSRSCFTWNGWFSKHFWNNLPIEIKNAPDIFKKKSQTVFDDNTQFYDKGKKILWTGQNSSFLTNFTHSLVNISFRITLHPSSVLYTN